MAAVLANLPYLLRGLELTIALAAISLTGSFVAGVVLALLRMSPWRWIRWPAILYIDVVRMIPLIMVIFWVFFLFPIMTGRPVAPVFAAAVALIAFNASYMAEIVRAGIESVPRGYVEAARGSGMSYLQSMAAIVLPIALKNMLPALVSRLIALLMGTSLAYIIGVTEFFRAANDINNRVLRPYEIYGFVAIVYFLLCYTLSLFGRTLERRLSAGEYPLGSARIASV
jgi:His/Glu/Gln/Arg/opine family amino acid ABC transporter permease subunit